jgi:uncharacterized protein (TIGR00369 family)
VAISTVEALNDWRSGLPALVGFEVTGARPGHLEGRMEVRPELLAPNGYLHAASVIAIADSACGFGTMVDLPDGARGFTTIELKSNFVGTVLNGFVSVVAARVHHGRTTQVWDATVQGDGRNIALFRCTQMILYSATSEPSDTEEQPLARKRA